MTQTLVSLWTEVRQRLEAAGVRSPVIDARMLVEAGAGVSRLDIVTDPRRPLSSAQIAAVKVLTKRREAREPVAHILGRREFWTLDLAVNGAVLVPRPETELLVELALEALPPNARARLLDLGVGSGAILLAILAERPRAVGMGVDRSEAALVLARENAISAGFAERVTLQVGDWAKGIDAEFDMIVSNPPYIPSDTIDQLDPEVARYEPRLALDGGADGLDALRAITSALPRLLRPGGAFALEVGEGQAPAVQALAEAAGLVVGGARRDLAGVERAVFGRRPP